MKIKNSSCMTLRLPPQLDELVTEASYDHRMSKAAWIRMAIKGSLGVDYSTRRATAARGNTDGR
jgi:hypothetical protein